MKKILLALLLLASQAQAQYAHRSNPGDPARAGAGLTTTGATQCPGTGCVVLGTQSTTTLTAVISGTWVATLQFSCSNDMWVTVTSIAADTFSGGSMSGAPATTTAVNGTFIMPTFGFRECGVYATAFTSNTSMSVRLDADPAPAVPIGATGNAALQVQVVPTTNASGAVSNASFVVNTAANVKASAGSVYGYNVASAAAAVCWLQFYNTAGAPTCGTAVVLAVPLAVTPGISFQPVGPIAIGNFAAGIGICVSTTPSGSTTCASAASGTVFFQ